MKVRITNEVLDTLFTEGRYVFYDDGTIQRTSDKSFVQMICPTTRKYGHGGNVQFNLYSDKYGVLSVTIKRLYDYGMKHNLLKHKITLQEYFKH